MADLLLAAVATDAKKLLLLQRELCRCEQRIKIVVVVVACMRCFDDCAIKSIGYDSLILLELIPHQR